jgi:hypothetical protein
MTGGPLVIALPFSFSPADFVFLFTHPLFRLVKPLTRFPLQLHGSGGIFNMEPIGQLSNGHEKTTFPDFIDDRR